MPLAVASEHAQFLRSAPSPRGLTRLAAEVDRRARVVSVRRLGGGLACATSDIEIAIGTRRERFVLKRFRPGRSGHRRELERLRLAWAAGLPAPEPIAAADAGAWF